MHTSSCSFNPLKLANWPSQRKGNEFASGAFPHIDPSKFDPSRIAEFAGLIIAVVLLAIVLGIVFLYISSVFRFILFDSVLKKSCAIREGWQRWHRAGRRYFLWQIVLLIAEGLFLGVLIGVPLAIAAAMGWFQNMDEHIGRTVLGVIFLIGVFLVFLLVAIAVQLLAKDFLVPIMALEEVDFAEAWSRLAKVIRPEPGRFAVYLLLKIVLAVAAAILFGILALIPMLVIIIPAVVAIFAGYAAGLGWNVATVSLAILLGSMLMALLFYMVALVNVPATVFFPAYSIYFFASRYPKLDALIHPPDPTPPLPVPEAPPVLQEPPTPEPTALPPEPEPIG